MHISNSQPCRQNEIRYIHNHQIDKDRWDSVVDVSSNGRIYGYSWYLDILADNWGALILGDYEYIMPLPFRRKYGIFYIYSPFFVQQLGVYSKQQVAIEMYAAFMRAIPSQFRYVDFSLSVDEEIPYKRVKAVKRRTNLVLDLDRPYEEIFTGYHKISKKLLRKNIPCRLNQVDDYGNIIALYQQINGHHFPEINDDCIRRLGDAAQTAAHKGQITAYRLNNELGETLAAHIFFQSHKRLYHMAGYQTELGKKNHGNYYFLDRVFQEHCEQGYIFDFEGSDLPGVADFFRKWGSVPEYYTRINMSRFPINLLLR